MLRYIFILLPLFVASLVWIWDYYEFNSDFRIYTILVILSTVGWLNFKSYSKFRKLLVVYITAAGLNEFCSYYSALWFGMNNPVYHVFSWIQLLLIGLLFSETLKLRKSKSALWFVIFVMVVVNLLNCTIFGSFKDFPSLNLTLLGALILTLLLFQFKQMIIYPIDLKLEKQPQFWFSFGTLVYVTFSFFMFGFLSTTVELPNWMYLILEGINIYLYATYFIALILDSKQKTIKNDSVC